MNDSAIKRKFQLLMISAMYENGGNMTHRFLDGHPQMSVYPFESQLGTRHVTDHLTSLFPVKYRWPVFELNATPTDDYNAMIDEECRVLARTPRVSKFRHLRFDFSDEERLHAYQTFVASDGRSCAKNVAAFFGATFETWRNMVRTGEEIVSVGYSPVVVVDTPRILSDFTDAHVLHVVRNPWSAFSDTKKRPVPLSLEHYMLGWAVNQYYATLFHDMNPDQVHLLRAEDIMADPHKALKPICEDLGLEPSRSLKTTTWNGIELEEIYPWGTIRQATPEANRKTALELSVTEREAVRQAAGGYLEKFDYKDFVSR